MRRYVVSDSLGYVMASFGTYAGAVTYRLSRGNAGWRIDEVQDCQGQLV